ncbi:ATP-binding protein [Microbacterium sp. LRZ72]|uniref:AlbA family DNA-binding domain-containing protein n=1 Tax=Microbacterium sp. LRZ72 TaxID=2942481 RepID=UPI0029AC3CCB|nr:ATP-binding protein [Microbacterium sp. LRZ72]MDX2377984.1 ATP-binding protein [Microbacterium sp. LRZ72]
MPQNLILVEFAVAVPIVLLASYLIALAIRALFGRRLSLSLPAMTLVSIGGTSVGLFVAGWFIAGLRLWMPTTLLLAFGCSIGLSFVVAALAVAVRRDPADVDVAKLLAAGESDRVEFKETARWNVRTQQRDTRMELVIAKTVAAFMNSGGGTLLIGADDAGEAIGLDRDLATLRVPDVDRYELWLRDMFSTLLGRNAAAQPTVRFATAPNGAVLCAIVCPAAAKPVFLTQSKDGSSTELWVRVGNSTRSFAVDEAVEYVARHWRARPGIALGRRARRESAGTG